MIDLILSWTDPILASVSFNCSGSKSLNDLGMMNIMSILKLYCKKILWKQCCCFPVVQTRLTTAFELVFVLQIRTSFLQRCYIKWMRITVGYLLSLLNISGCKSYCGVARVDPEQGGVTAVVEEDQSGFQGTSNSNCLSSHPAFSRWTFHDSNLMTVHGGNFHHMTHEGTN